MVRNLMGIYYILAGEQRKYGNDDDIQIILG